ncbi:hypothetical protein WA026_011008 [Henosepilachna vigintioctopunctata]|uniref:Uncharacterized protein n=1 Tax=Henosepilachna vigintioctopunctata TaxID=420089 RepID=A0AAW1UZY9_9CUCU
MGKKLLRKLGSVLRVFRARRRKNADTSNDESTALTNSESLIKTSDTSSSQQVVYFGNSVERKKSISLEDIGVSAEYSTDNLNKLKRTHGTCDIFEAEPNNPIRCTRSLHRFCKLNDKRCLLSYNATLHGGATWSQALSRAITPYVKNEDKDTSSTTQAESEPLLSKQRDYFESYGLMKLHTIDTKKVYSSKERVVEETTTTSSHYTDSYIQSEKTDDSSKSNYVATTRQHNTERYSTSYSSDVRSVEISEHMQEPSEATGEELSSADNKSVDSSSKSKEDDMKPHVGNSKTHTENRETYNCIKSKTEKTTSRISTNKQTSQILLEKQRVQVNMEFQTVRNEEGFALLKYDMDGSSAKGTGSFLDMYANKLLMDEKVENGIRECDASLTNNTSSKTQSGSSTDYDVGNLAQVDLLEEFRTTIANMRNVLDAIEVKKSIEGIIRQSMSEKTLNEHISKFMEPNNKTNLPTCFNTVCNQLSTSTDVDFWSSRNKGCRTMPPSSDLVSNNDGNSKKYDSSVSKSIKPAKKVQKRKRRRKIDAKLSRKPANHAISSSNKTPKIRTKPEKPQYNKCVVYHITQHKQAADRCVGTSRPTSKKESVVLHETFSALHFGPIQEFPVLLHKHENEELKNRELKGRTKQEKTVVSSSSIKKLTFKELNRVRSEMEAKSDKPSSATAENKTTSSYMSSPSTTANWFVFDPAPPLILENSQPTSDDTVFDKNSSSCSTHDKPLEENSKDDSNDMDLVKYEAGSKGDDVSKDMSHITITVNVPIKKILSRLKSSEKKGNNDGKDCEASSDGQRKLVPNNLLCDFGIQVKKSNNSTSVQTTPRGGMSSTSHDNEPKDSKTSLKRLSSFKKIFGRKAMGLNASSGLVRTSSTVYISDRSTSCPRFYKTAYNDPKCTDKNISVELKGTKYVIPQDMSEFGVNTNLEKEGFFLNLPRTRYRKKRQQISRLFDGSDSSNSKFFEDSKLLYHVHDSSFYSSSKTEQEPFSKLITSQDGRKMSYVPIHSVTSSVDIKLEPCNSAKTIVPSKEEIEKKPNDIDNTLAPEANETDEIEADKIVKGVILKILDDKTFADLGVQCDKFVFLSQGEVGINTTNEVTHTERETDTYFKVDDLFMHNIPKVRFEDEVYAIRDEEDSGFKSRFTTSSQENTAPNRNEKMKTDQTKNDCMVNRKFSVGQFFPEIDYKRATSDGILNYVRKIDADNPDRYAKMTKNPHSILNRANFEVSTGPKLQSPKQVTLDSKIEDSARQIPLRHTCEGNSSLKSCMINSSDHCSNVNLCRNEHRRVSFDNVKQTKNMSQLKHILNLNNFENSRDSIVDLILYNLMKEIIAENSDQLNEEGKIKMECLLADFIRDFKCETKNKNIQMVESVIQNLVKEIRSNDIYASNESNELKCKPTLPKKDGKKYVKNSNVKYGRKKHGIKSQVYYEERGMTKRSNSDQWECGSSYRKSENPRCNREKQIVWDENTAKYRVTQDSQQQYTTLIEKVRQLENVTKQLVVVAQNQSLPIEKKYPEKRSHFQDYQNVYPIFVDNNSPTHPTKTTSKTTTRRKNIVVRKVRRNILNINYLKNKSSPAVGVSRRHSKSPTTNIVINLSDWRSASRTSSTSTAYGNSSASTNDNVQCLKDESLILTVDEDVIEEKSGIMHKPTINSDKFDQNASLSRNRNSLTITISGKNNKRGDLPTSTRRPIKKRRDYIKIRMMRKKLTSCSDHVNPDYRVSENKKCNDIDINEVYKLTKQYIEKQYAVRGDNLCSNLAQNLLGRDYNMTEVLGQKRNLDLAYQRMANFCMFRGLLKKKQKFN